MPESLIRLRKSCAAYHTRWNVFMQEKTKIGNNVFKRYALALIIVAIAACASQAASDAPLFVEITAELGFRQTDALWPAGTYALHEVIGSGLALFDFNGDGALDILHIRFPPPGQSDVPAPNRLYRQQSDGTFVDVTETAVIGHPGYGQGVAIGDVDNDGDADVYVTNFGPDVFYRNNGDSTFALESVGLSNDAWGTSAAFGDVNRDGYLDLYVANYVQFDAAAICRGKHGARDYCNPQRFPPAPDRLFLNNGDGTFTDVTEQVGIAVAPGRGLGVVCLDLTGDGWSDFYVANDGEANQLWVNQKDGTFTEEAILRGLAFNTYGQPEGSMGIAVGDVNGDTHPELFVTHLTDETNTLYIGGSSGATFMDMTEVVGFAGRDVPFTGFGCGFIDFDNDADVDIAVVNGRVKRGPVIPVIPVSEDTKAGEFWGFYAEPNLLFQNSRNGRQAELPIFTDVSSRASDFTGQIEVSRGAAFGDIDRDGDVDIVVSTLDNRLRVFRNDAPPPEHNWLLVRAMAQNRDALGAQVTIKMHGKASQAYTGFVLPNSSYLSSSEPSVHFGLGTTDTIQAIEVRWPDGSREQFHGAAVNQRVTVYQGKGEPF